MSFQTEIKKEKLALSTFTRSPDWPKLRRLFLKQHPRCEVCGATKKLEAHHVIPFHLKPELELDVTNLITLCDGGANHHLTFGHMMSYRSFNRNVIDDAKRWSEKINSRPKPWELELEELEEVN